MVRSCSAFYLGWNSFWFGVPFGWGQWREYYGFPRRSLLYPGAQDLRVHYPFDCDLVLLHVHLNTFHTWCGESPINLEKLVTSNNSVRNECVENLCIWGWTSRSSWHIQHSARPQTRQWVEEAMALPPLSFLLPSPLSSPPPASLPSSLLVWPLLPVRYASNIDRLSCILELRKFSSMRCWMPRKPQRTALPALLHPFWNQQVQDCGRKEKGSQPSKEGGRVK